MIIMKKTFAICFITISFITVAVTEDCDRCVEKEECPSFGKLSQEAQAAWQSNYPCSGPKDKEQAKLFGFAATAKGDYVCCINALWGTTQSSSSNIGLDRTATIYKRHTDYKAYYDPYNNYGDQNSGYDDYQNPRPPRKSNGYDNNRYNNGWGSNQYPNNRGDYNNDNGNYPYNTNRGNAPKNYINANNSPYVTRSPFFPGNSPGYNGHSNEGGQCPVTSFPPAPETGCCGREATDTDRIIGHQPRPNAPANSPSNGYQSWPYGRRNYEPGFNRGKRAVDDEVNVTIEDRIAGGRETDLEQFPWTVLLKVNFDYGNKRAAFNCGGSLISSRYVLSAGHCVYEEGAKVVDIDVYLAEYDKRTFPKDCKNVLGQGQKCIENIVIKSEEVILHPQYEDAQLKNDVSLIRLQTAAPYTDYIRPICLPTIDIDTPKFSNLRLAVAGWGRNGRYRSDIKQSTIVNLVPQEKCSESYPGLSRQNICAAGYTGQDTCKGDSGGPLMTMYGGKYQVVGVVSGKRADSPCGTSVPSLYTNVYHYLDWIRRSIKQ